MARRALGSVAILLVAAALGCSTTQPTAKPAQSAQVTFQANAPRVLLYEVWDATLVTVTSYPDNPGRPPDQVVADLGLWCDVAASADLQQRLSATYPFRFSVEIEVIRAGTSTIERISGASYASSYGSVTAYDETPAATTTTHLKEWSRDLSDDSTPDVKVTLTLKNGRRISTASRDFIEKIKIPSNTSTSYGSQCPYGGPTSAAILGDPGVAGSPSSFGFELNAGDTVIVKARKDTNPAATALFTNAPPTFGSQIYLEGKDVSSSLVGNTFSPQNSQDGISYSFTLR
jgi:hypothetical protein